MNSRPPNRRAAGKHDRELRQVNITLKRIADALENLYKLARREATTEQPRVEVKINPEG